jgi:hypothetical protein
MIMRLLAPYLSEKPCSPKRSKPNIVAPEGVYGALWSRQAGSFYDQDDGWNSPKGGLPWSPPGREILSAQSMVSAISGDNPQFFQRYAPQSPSGMQGMFLGSTVDLGRAATSHTFAYGGGGLYDYIAPLGVRHTHRLDSFLPRDTVIDYAGSIAVPPSIGQYTEWFLEERVRALEVSLEECIRKMTRNELLPQVHSAVVCLDV